MAMENKRITQLSTERLTLTSGDYVMVDDENNGSAKYRLDRLKETDSTLSVSGKAADAAATGQAISDEATARGNAVTAEAEARAAADTAESQARSAADTALGNDIGDLKSALNYVANDGLVVLQPALEAGWIDTSGQNNPNYNTLRTVDYIEANEPYYNIHHLPNYAIAIKTYDANKQFVRSVYSTDGDTKIFLRDTEKYIRYCLNNITHDYVVYPVTRDCGFISYEAHTFARIESDIFDIDSEVFEIENLLIDDYVDVTDSFGTLSEGYIYRTDGAYVSYDDCQATGYIPIDDLKGCFITAKAKFQVAIYAIYLDNQGDFLASFDRGSETELTVNRYVFPYFDILKTYPNAQYVRLSSYEDDLVIEKGVYADKPSVVTANPLYGKKIIAIGDSMVKGHSLSESKVWLTLIANRNNMTYVNYGANGRQIANVATPYHDADYSVYANYGSMVNDADIVILFAGTNDSNYELPLGTEDSSDVTTVCGALNSIFDGMKTKYPDKLIVVFTPYERTTPSGRDTIYAEAIENMAHKFGIPVFNNVKNGGISWNNTTQTGLLCLDSTHLNEKGHEFASKRYEGFIRSLM